MVTQKQIAKKLGISPSLVSRALSGTAREIGASEETINRIVTMAREVNYVPNPVALALKGKKHHTIGVVTYDFEDPYFAEILSMLQHVGHPLGFSFVITGAYKRQEKTIDLRPLIKHAIEGLVVIGSGASKDWLEPFVAHRIPIIQIGQGLNAIANLLCDDEDAGSALIADHLIEGGADDYLIVVNDSFPHRLRRDAFLRALSARGIEVPAANVFTFDDTHDAIADIARHVDKSASKRIALMAGDDDIAIRAIRRLHDLTVGVPGRLLVTGFDDIPAGRHCIPSITTIRRPLDQIIDSIMRILGNDAGAPSTQKFLPQLIARESSISPT